MVIPIVLGIFFIAAIMGIALVFTADTPRDAGILLLAVLTILFYIGIIATSIIITVITGNPLWLLLLLLLLVLR